MEGIIWHRFHGRFGRISNGLTEDGVSACVATDFSDREVGCVRVKKEMHPSSVVVNVEIKVCSA